MLTKNKSKYRKSWYVCFNPYAESGKIQKLHKTLESAIMETGRLTCIEKSEQRIE